LRNTGKYTLGDVIIYRMQNRTSLLAAVSGTMLVNIAYNRGVVAVGLSRRLYRHASRRSRPRERSKVRSRVIARPYRHGRLARFLGKYLTCQSVLLSSMPWTRVVTALGDRSSRRAAPAKPPHSTTLVKAVMLSKRSIGFAHYSKGSVSVLAWDFRSCEGTERAGVRARPSEPGALRTPSRQRARDSVSRVPPAPQRGEAQPPDTVGCEAGNGADGLEECAHGYALERQDDQD